MASASSQDGARREFSEAIAGKMLALVGQVLVSGWSSVLPRVTWHCVARCSRGSPARSCLAFQSKKDQKEGPWFDSFGCLLLVRVTLLIAGFK